MRTNFNSQLLMFDVLYNKSYMDSIECVFYFVLKGERLCASRVKRLHFHRSLLTSQRCKI